MFHPWRVLRSFEESLTCSIEPTPGNVPEWWSPANRHIILAPGQLQVDRRCNLAHALAHVDLQHSGYDVGPDRIRLTKRQEIQADLQAARWLMPDLEQIGTALVWAYNLAEAAEELWVTEHLLTVRLAQMPSRHKKLLRDRLSAEGH